MEDAAMSKKPPNKEKQSTQGYTEAEIEKLGEILEKLRVQGFAIYQSDAHIWKRVLGKWAESQASPLLKIMYLLEEAEVGRPMTRTERVRYLRDVGNEIAIEFSANNAEYFEVLARYLKSRQGQEVPKDDLSRPEMGLPKKRGRAGQPGDLNVIFPTALMSIIAQRIPGGVLWCPMPIRRKLSAEEKEEARKSIPTDLYNISPQPRPPLKPYNYTRITRSELKDWVEKMRKKPGEKPPKLTETELSRQIKKWGMTDLMA